MNITVECPNHEACGGELVYDVFDDDPSPPGVGLSPGSYRYVEPVDQTCKCELTAEQVNQLEDKANDKYNDDDYL